MDHKSSQSGKKKHKSSHSKQNAYDNLPHDGRLKPPEGRYDMGFRNLPGLPNQRHLGERGYQEYEETKVTTSGISSRPSKHQSYHYNQSSPNQCNMLQSTSHKTAHMTTTGVPAGSSTASSYTPSWSDDGDHEIDPALGDETDELDGEASPYPHDSRHTHIQQSWNPAGNLKNELIKLRMCQCVNI